MTGLPTTHCSSLPPAAATSSPTASTIVRDEAAAVTVGGSGISEKGWSLTPSANHRSSRRDVIGCVRLLVAPESIL